MAASAAQEREDRCWMHCPGCGHTWPYRPAFEVWKVPATGSYGWRATGPVDWCPKCSYTPPIVVEG